ncbi:MAG: DUF362 domain-containing protein [Acidobacteriia bacterium]|nr:DUF362 domain-containing protein [Terriglobia bacterium]
MTCFNRRNFLRSAAAAPFLPIASLRAEAPAAPVAVAQCKSYGQELLPTLDEMFDQLGGLERIVSGKTVAIKVNLTGSPMYRLGHDPAELAHWTHPNVIGCVMHLMNRAGARRIRILESPWNTTEPLEQYMLEGGWNPSDLLHAATRVEMENTNYLGAGRKYSRLMVPGGGHMFRGFDLNHSYEECDVFVSIAKMKEHATAGVTLSMKNCFGITPCTIYGQGSPKDEPGQRPAGGRGPFHSGDRQPAASALPENDPSTPRQGGYRVPRIVADLVAARPIHLAVIDGIESMAGGEGPWNRGVRRASPGVLIAGTNCVTTDAVGTAIMGFDPMATRGTPPFEHCDSTLQLAELHGLGTRNLSRIEVLGAPIQKVLFPIRKV